MKVFCFLFGFCLMAGMASADDLTWNTLVGRPDLWPAQCSMKVPIQFQGGVGVAVGQKVNALQFDATQVEVSTLDGKTNFTAAPEEIDCLQLANQQYGQLTPKQKELSYALLSQRKDLWPAYVTLNYDVNLGSLHVPQGTKVKVVDIQSNSVLVLAEDLKARFKVTPRTTDLLSQARQLVENGQGATGSGTFLAAQKRDEDNRLINQLQGKLLNAATDQPQPLDATANPKYIVFLRGSHTCPITHKFLPDVVNFYNQMKPKHPEFEIVYIMYDSLNDTSQFSKEQNFSSWRVLAYDNTPSIPRAVIDGRLPQLFVMDRSGKVLINGIQYDAPRALNELNALLSKS